MNGDGREAHTVAQSGRKSDGFTPPQCSGSTSSADSCKISPVILPDAVRELLPNRLSSAFEAIAARQPHAIAAVLGADRLSYAELDARANSLAARLRGAGVGAETLVAIYIDRSLDMLVGLLAVLKAGGAYVPLDAAYPAERIQLIVQDAQPALIVTSRRLDVRFFGAARVVCIDEPDRVEFSVRGSSPAIRGDDLAYVIYTSGSTGIPKGVQVSNRSIVSLFSATGPLFDFGPTDVWTAFHSYGFDLSVWEIFGCLLTGGRLVLVPRRLTQSPGEFCDLLRREGVTVLSQTPSALRQLAYAQRRKACAEIADLALRTIVCGGEALPRDLALQVLDWGVPLWNFYGPTEASVWVTAGRVTAEGCLHDVVPVGRPFANARVYILDRDLQPTSPGVAGEVCLAGTALARGYLNRPDLTEAKFVRTRIHGREERIYRTGDRGRYTEEGDLQILGRSDDQVKIRGFRVELGDIEAALRQHPVVEECAVTADSDGGERRLVAYIVRPPAVDSSASDLREFLRGKLPEYMLPAAYIAIEKLPMNASGKLDKSALPLPQSVETNDVLPGESDGIEAQLSEIWRRLLRVKEVSVRQNFYELGGDSVLAVDLFCEIEKICGRYLPLVTLLENQTIEQLAAVIRGSEPESVTNRSLIPVRSQGTETPIFLIHPVGGTILGFKDLLRHLHSSRPLYGLQSRGLNDEGVPFRRVEDMAAYYVNEIRSVTAGGPYALVGLCFGAVVAFEMAQQLVRAGEQIRLLCMLDPDPPDYSSVEAPLTRRVQAKWELLWSRSGRDRLSYLAVQARNTATKIRRTLAHIRHPVEPGEVEVANYEAIRTYRPSPLPVPFTIFRALERPEIEYMSQLEWRGYAGDGMDVETVPGNHLTMMEEPHVRVLASKLEHYLQKASFSGTSLCVAAAALGSL